MMTATFTRPGSKLGPASPASYQSGTQLFALIEQGILSEGCDFRLEGENLFPQLGDLTACKKDSTGADKMDPSDGKTHFLCVLSFSSSIGLERATSILKRI